MRCSYHNKIKIKINVSTIWSLKPKLYLDSISSSPLFSLYFLGPNPGSHCIVIMSPKCLTCERLWLFFCLLASIILRNTDEISCGMLANIVLPNNFLILTLEYRVWGKNMTEMKFLITSYQGINVVHIASLEMLTCIFYFR